MFTKDQVNDIKKQAIDIIGKKFTEGNDREAELLANQFLKVDPKNTQIMQILGLIKYKANNYEMAVEVFKQIIELEPENYENYNNIGLCYSSMGKYSDSIEVIKKAVELNPNLNFVYSNLGLQYRNNKQIEEAISSFEKSLKIKETPETWDMLGSCYGEIRNLDLAEKCFLSALLIDPNHAGSHVNLASIYQLRGEWKKAWPEYEWRFQLYEQTKFWESIYDPHTKWDGKKEITNKRILVHSEQGIGDVIHFFRYVKFLKEKGAIVILHCCDTLESLLRPFVDEIYVKEPSEIPIFSKRPDDFGIPKYDYQCSIISLPYLLDLNYIPNSPYLDCASFFNTDDYKSFFKVGIVWAGNPQHPNDSSRSCHLKFFKSIHDLPNVKLFNLQKDMRSRIYRFQTEPIDLASDAENMKIIDVSEYQTDFEKTAAIIKSMDLIITVDTAILHLAGALDKKTFALISNQNDWRWLLDNENTEWYKSVKIFRQKKINNWEEVFESVKNQLKELL